jgi:hypothetical protein
MHMRSWGQSSPRGRRGQARSGEELPAGPSELATGSVRQGQTGTRRGVAGAARRVCESRSGGIGSSLPFSSLARTTTRRSREVGAVELLPVALRLRPLRDPSAAKGGGWCCDLSPPRHLPRHRRIQSRGARGLVQLSSSSQWARMGWPAIAREPPAEGPGGWGRSGCGSAVTDVACWKGKLQLLICCWRYPFEKERQSAVHER